ncbi:MAG: DUF1552 domain-containing protein [Myxococcota bacterium]|nr:DUF1552 domain-containing protein [Myxococcota bacterium]
MKPRDLLHSGRRGFLRGLGGAAVALPLLEMTHSRALAGGAPAERRFVVFFEHGGTISNMKRRGRFDGRGTEHGLDHWAPTSAPGAALRLGSIHQPLAAHRDELTVIEGLDNAASPIAHRGTNVTALTAARLVEVGTETRPKALALGPSIDHVVHERLSARGQRTAFGPIHLRAGSVPFGGGYYGSPFYSGSRAEVIAQADPVAAFDNLFAGFSSMPDAEVARRRTIRESVLSGVTGQLRAYRGVASSIDLAAIDQHLGFIRDLEVRLGLLETAVCEAPVGIEADGAGAARARDWRLVAELHADIVIAALRCGLTNSACIEIDDILTPWAPAGGPAATPGIRVDSNFGIGHSLGHTARDIGPTGPRRSEHDAWMAEAVANRRWRMSILGRILDGLAATTTGDGETTLLDNSLVLATSEFSNAAAHVATNVPVLLAGRAGGAITGGTHLSFDRATTATAYDTRHSLSNLHTSILHAFGETDAHFGTDDAALRGATLGALPGLVA